MMRRVLIEFFGGCVFSSIFCYYPSFRKHLFQIGLFMTHELTVIRFVFGDLNQFFECSLVLCIALLIFDFV